MRYKMVISYDGSKYYGFQRQKNVKSIQGELENFISKYLSSSVLVKGSGRTDKGVHAKGQVINFITSRSIPKDRFIYALNKQLPFDIKVLSIKYVDLSFHARFSAKKKEYKYFIKTKGLSAFDSNYYVYEPNLDVSLMNEAIKLFEGTHDFKGFCAMDINPLKDTTKTIYKVDIKEKRDMLVFSFTGSGFLKYQIRRMMAILIEIGKHKESVETIKYILENKDPLKFSKVAKPNGLYLYHVYY